MIRGNAETEQRMEGASRRDEKVAENNVSAYIYDILLVLLKNKKQKKPPPHSSLGYKES